MSESVTEALVLSSEPQGLQSEHLESASQQQDLLCQFVREQLTQGTDYGKSYGRSSKDELLKPGATKLVGLFRCAMKMECLRENIDLEKQLYDYKYKCTLTLKDGMEIEGDGTCNNKEKGKGHSEDNTICKMAQKRALVGACLHLPGVSAIFTQDMDSVPQGRPKPNVYMPKAKAKKVSTEDLDRLHTTLSLAAKDADEKLLASAVHEISEMSKLGRLTDADRSEMLAMYERARDKINLKKSKDDELSF